MSLRQPGGGPRLWVALWIVYIVWGSTYLAIRVMVRTMPPLLASGFRFALAGALLCGWIAARRGPAALRVSGRQLMSVAVVGVLLPAGGNGLVTVAERHIPSSLAALLIATVPLWVGLLRAADGQRPPRATVVGICVGFGGVALLLTPGAQSGGVRVGGVVLILVASLSWAAGSFAAPRMTMPRDPFVATGLEMLVGGLALVTAGLIAGEAGDLRPGRFSAESLAGFAYLVTIGSIVAYSAYVWLLANAPISKVSTYAYVNPAIAVLLGWAILGERITIATLVGAAVIVASVAAIVRRETGPGPTPPAEPLAAAAGAGAGGDRRPGR